MKAELRVLPHNVLPGQHTIEVWWGGRLVGTVVGADGPGVRFISPFNHDTIRGPSTGGLNVTEVRSNLPQS